MKVKKMINNSFRFYILPIVGYEDSSFYSQTLSRLYQQVVSLFAALIFSVPYRMIHILVDKPNPQVTL